ncbi:glutathione S-transferase N-terminal domain-containing protein [Acidithiobacillus thiooxidans]|nr:glutathione S-transferase N-terminal domain-containing protein [Acidithiobacillus thiooxidans]
MLTLIHFDFCPFCQRVRLALGYKGIVFNEQPARFYGPEHFQSISGFDRLPVVEYPDGSRQGESLEIIAELDRRFPETPPLWRGAISDKEWEGVQAWRAHQWPAISTDRAHIAAICQSRTGFPRNDLLPGPYGELAGRYAGGAAGAS